MIYKNLFEKLNWQGYNTIFIQKKISILETRS